MTKLTQFPRVLSVPWLRAVRVRQLKLFDQNNNYNPVINHSKWVSLSHTLFTIENIGCPIPSYQDKRVVMTIAVLKNELQTSINGGPSKTFQLS